MAPKARTSIAAKDPAAKHLCQALFESLFSGSGHRIATTPAKAGWLYRFAECPYGKTGRITFSHRLTCHGCERPQAHAMNPPASQRMPPSDPTTRTRTSPASKGNPDKDKVAAPPQAVPKPAANTTRSTDDGETTAASDGRGT